MTIDINLLRVERGGDPEKVRDSERRRFRDPSLVDRVIGLDEEWRKQQFELEKRKKEVNLVKKEIGERKKQDKTDKCEALVEQKTANEALVKELEESVEAVLLQRDSELGKIGCILDPSVPTFKDEEDKVTGKLNNEVVALWKTPTQFAQPFQTNGFRPHYELVEMVGGVNFEAGRDVFGSRGYFLTGPLVLLNQALINYGLAFLMRQGYSPVQPPFMMKKEVMGQAAELKDYDDVLYKVVEENGDGTIDEEKTKYLIATSEQPITAYYRNKVLAKEQLPTRFAGISSCFRKEAGSSGRDIRGIFRVHQFEKIEQFCIVDEDKSIEEHEKIIAQAQSFYQSLEIPYRVINIVSGEINDAASKKYDLEAWFPGDNEGKGQYRELVSASNCLDFQARRMNTRAGYDKDQVVPHMLNATLCATERAMCCLLENYQTEEGIRVPRVLVPFMAGMEFIPFTHPPPVAEKPIKKKK